MQTNADTAQQKLADERVPKLLWCPDSRCPKHNTLQGFTGYTRQDSVCRHIRRQHPNAAKLLMASLAVTVANQRYWCPQADCPNGRDLGFQGWELIQDLQQHLKGHASDTVDLSMSPACDLGQPTAGKAAELWSATADVAKLQGRYWCSIPFCPKQHGLQNGFAGYSAPRSLQRHIRKAHWTASSRHNAKSCTISSTPAG